MALKSWLKKSINAFLGNFGVEMRKISREENAPAIETPQTEQQSDDLAPYRWLINQKIRTVLDIGANTGQFAEQIHEILPRAKIVSFEPLKDCYEELVKNGERLGQFSAYNCALGREEGEALIYRSEFSPSSSLRPMGALHKAAFPFTKRGTVEKISVKKLDTIKGLDVSLPMLIKIDVQGFEDEVIDGGSKTIGKAQVLIVETSFQTLYKGQPMFDEIYTRLKKLGFSYHGNWYQDNDSRNGSALQADAIFIKSAK